MFNRASVLGTFGNQLVPQYCNQPRNLDRHLFNETMMSGHAMAIRMVKPPKTVRAALDQGLIDMFGQAERDAYRFLPIGRDDAPMVPDPAREGFPHQVYGVTLKDMAGGKGLIGAFLVGWRHMHLKAGNSSGLASMATDVYPGAKGRGHQFGGTNEGPFVAQTLEMLQKAARMKKVRAGDFRPCLLRIPALYVVPVWLISEDGPEADVIIPMDPCHRALKPGRAYSREQLHKCLQKPARESLEYHSRPQPEP